MTWKISSVSLSNDCVQSFRTHGTENELMITIGMKRAKGGIDHVYSNITPMKYD